MDRISVLQIPLDNFSRTEINDCLFEALQHDGPCLITTPNPEILLGSRNDLDFRRALQTAQLSIPDGYGIECAVAALYGKAIARHPGVDLLQDLLALCNEKQARVLIFGGYSKSLKIVEQNLALQFPNLNLLTIDPGIIADNLAVAPEVAVQKALQFSPQVLVVALGQGRGHHQGKQEKVLIQLAGELPMLKIAIGVGGAIDFIAKTALRPSPSWRERGLEWLVRLWRQPWRWRRVLNAVVVFPIIIAIECWQRGHFLRSTTWVTQFLTKSGKFKSTI